MPKEENKEYRTHQIRLKKGHRLFDYAQKMCENSKNMYNTTNFYLRQVYTAMKTDKKLQPLQQQVINEITKHLPSMNQTQTEAYNKKIEKEKLNPSSKKKEIKLNLFDMPSKKKAFLSYNFLDSLFKDVKQNDYRSLPTQTAQTVMKSVMADWKSFFESMKEYKVNPGKFTGKPKIPRYSKASEKEVYFTNQDCVIKEGKLLKFPLIREHLNIGKIANVEGKLKEVRIIPSYGEYVVECVFEVGKAKEIVSKEERLMSIDLGIDNLATITTNTGINPVLVKGKHVKSINAYYNKEKAHHLSVLRQGKETKEGPFTSRKLEKLHLKRHVKIKDIFHKSSFHIVELAEQEQIDTIIIGKNEGWKNGINIGKRNNQNFCHIPYNMLIEMIQYKANKKGIKVVVTEESYTSKASFIDDDIIPTYNGTKNTHAFSGKRIKRGLYKTEQGFLISADVNGSANIMKKYILNTLKKPSFNVKSVCIFKPTTFVA